MNSIGRCGHDLYEIDHHSGRGMQQKQGSEVVAVVENTLADVRQANDRAAGGGEPEHGVEIPDGKNRSRPGKPLVSIITATYNAAGYLPNLARSIRGQTYGNVEWIVVDGSSKDGTLDILRQNEDVVDYWISEPDRGIYDAWNKGLRLARGEWVCFLGADDQLLPDAIESMVNCVLFSQRSLEFVSGRVKLFQDGKGGRTIGRPWNWSEFRRYMCVAHTGSMHRATYFRQYGEFDASYRISGDYEILLRAGRHLRAGFVDQVLAHAALGGVSNRENTVFRENLRAKLRHGACGPLTGIVFMAWAQFKWTMRGLLGK